MRNAALDCGIIDILIEYIEKVCSKNGVWALCNLLRGQPTPDSMYYSKAFPVIIKRGTCARKFEDNESAEDCLWTLAELSENINVISYLLTESNYLLQIANLLEIPTMTIITPVLRILTNVLSNDSKLVYELLSSSFLPRFLQLFEHSNLQIRLETCLLLSTLITANTNIVDLLIEYQVVSKLLHMVKTDHKDVVRESCWIINKITKTADCSQMMDLCKLGALEILCELLSDMDPKILLIVLEVLQNFLHTGELENDGTDNENFYALKLESISAIKKIELLQDFPNELVYKKSLGLLETFFVTEEI